MWVTHHPARLLDSLDEQLVRRDPLLLHVLDHLLFAVPRQPPGLQRPETQSQVTPAHAVHPGWHVDSESRGGTWSSFRLGGAAMFAQLDWMARSGFMKVGRKISCANGGTASVAGKVRDEAGVTV